LGGEAVPPVIADVPLDGEPSGGGGFTDSVSVPLRYELLELSLIVTVKLTVPVVGLAIVTVRLVPMSAAENPAGKMVDARVNG
jgi:hypothetical protein